MVLAKSVHFWPNWVSPTLNLPPLQRGDALRGRIGHHLGGHQLVQPLQVPGQTDKAPLPSGGLQPAQRELAESQDLFDNANDRLNRGLAPAVNGLAQVSLKLVGHLDDRASVIRGWLRRLGKTFLPAAVMGLTPGSNEGLNLPGFQVLDVLGGTVDFVQGCGFGVTNLRRNGIDRRDGFISIDRMIGQAVTHHKQVPLLHSHLHVVMLIKATIGAILHNPGVWISKVVLILGPGAGRLGRLGFWSSGFTPNTRE